MTLRGLCMLGGAAWLIATALGGCVVEEVYDDDDTKKKGTGGASQQEPEQGVCLDACPKECADDGDCDLSVGELCCDYGEHGKACAPAASCPRFCGADSECNTGQGEACLRTTLMSPQAVCTQPEAGLRLCQNDQSCGTGERCCGAYKEPVCLPTWACPEACTDSSSCNTAVGEVCCTTIGLVDSTIASPGICAGSALCPRACAQSSNCRTDIGEVCCEGVCAASCAGRCDTSNDCVAQVCCKSPVVESPWLGSVNGPGYPGGDPPGCLRCSDAFNGPIVPEQVCGSSIAVTQALLGCMCQNCAVDCDELCGGSEYPSTYCNLCVQDYCPEETDACLSDQ